MSQNELIKKERKRRPELSMLNVLFCLTVIFIHVISSVMVLFQPGTVEYNVLMIPWRLSTFVVQGFIMLAGLKIFLNGKDKLPFHRYITRRFLAIIVPYTLCYAIYYVYYVVVYDYVFDIKFMLELYLVGGLACHMYFIPLIFQFDLLFPLWKRVVNKFSPVIILPVALLGTAFCEVYLPQLMYTFFPSFNFMYNDRLFTTYLIYWLMGCYIGKYYDAFCDMLKKNFGILTVIYLGLALAEGLFSYIAFNAIAYIPCLYIIHTLYVIYTCIFLFAVFLKWGDKAYNKIPLVSKIDKWSFYIYLYHMLFVLALQYYIAQFYA